MLLLSLCKTEQVLLFIIRTDINIGNVFDLSCIIISSLFLVPCHFIYFIYHLHLQLALFAGVIFQIWCHSYVKPVPHWLPIILIFLTNDVDLNPGPQFQNNFYNFMSWNVNSSGKYNFQRVCLIEAHNSIFNYDLISICETSLNDSRIPETLLNGYMFVPVTNPANIRRGGVGLFYKNSLPVIARDDWSFKESIVVELKFGRKKYFLPFYIVLLLLTIPVGVKGEFCAKIFTISIATKTLKDKGQFENPSLMRVNSAKPLTFEA